MISRIISISCLLFIVGCKQESSTKVNIPQEAGARTVLNNTRHLTFEGNDIATDGGSLIYIFQTENETRLDVFIKAQFDENYELIDVTDSSQPIQIRLDGQMREDMHTIEHLSAEEKKLLALVSDTMNKAANSQNKKALDSLLSIIQTRNYPWSEIGPKPKSNIPSNQSVDPTR